MRGAPQRSKRELRWPNQLTKNRIYCSSSVEHRRAGRIHDRGLSNLIQHSRRGLFTITYEILLREEPASCTCTSDSIAIDAYDGRLELRESGSAGAESRFDTLRYENFGDE